MKVRSITSFIRRRSRLQECSHGAAGPQFCSKQNRTSEQFWVLAMRMPLRRDSGGVKGREQKGREREKQTEGKKQKKTRKKKKQRKGERKKKRRERKKEGDPPQNLAPQGIIVGTLTPKTALKCDFACCRTAALQLRDCIPEVSSAVE